MRLDKYLSQVTDYSRSEGKRLIRTGHVSVAGNVVVDPREEVDNHVAIAVNGERLRAANPRYFMLHKPDGYISATKDRQHLTALELFDEDNVDQLHIAGRLDIDTTGLLLVSDDGQWCHRITSPKSHCKKTYRVETADPITAEAIEKIEQGIHLSQEKRPTLPATLHLIDEHTARLTITEGKYHQVKRMFAAVGNKVDCLHRERIGNIILGEDLAPGEYRPLTAEEVASV
ncbi:MAG: 16S rRNA pseudouridine(516) synthase RsuA [Oceanicoccus sp.]